MLTTTHNEDKVQSSTIGFYLEPFSRAQKNKTNLYHFLKDRMCSKCCGALFSIRAIVVCLVSRRGRPEERGGARWRAGMLRKSTVSSPAEEESTSLSVERGKHELREGPMHGRRTGFILFLVVCLLLFFCFVCFFL